MFLLYKKVSKFAPKVRPRKGKREQKKRKGERREKKEKGKKMKREREDYSFFSFPTLFISALIYSYLI